MAGLLQGVIDAANISPPSSPRARDAGLRELVNIAHLKLPFVQTAVGATRAYPRDQPEAVRRFLRANIEGVKLAREQPDAARAAIAKYTKTDDPAVLAEVYDTYVNIWGKRSDPRDEGPAVNMPSRPPRATTAA